MERRPREGAARRRDLDRNLASDLQKALSPRPPSRAAQAWELRDGVEVRSISLEEAALIAARLLEQELPLPPPLEGASPHKHGEPREHEHEEVRSRRQKNRPAPAPRPSMTAPP